MSGCDEGEVTDYRNVRGLQVEGAGRGGIPSAFSGDDSLVLPHGLLDLFLKLLTFKSRTRAAGQRERAKP